MLHDRNEDGDEVYSCPGTRRKFFSTSGKVRLSASLEIRDTMTNFCRLVFRPARKYFPTLKHLSSVVTDLPVEQVTVS